MLVLDLYMFTVHMCSLLITFKASVPICGWPQSDSSPFKVAPGRRSDVTTTSADWSRLPGPAMHPVSVASLLPRATTASTQEMAILKYELQKTMRTGEAWMIAETTTVWATEDNFTVFPHFLPSSTSETPDICSASDLCLFMSSLFTFVAARFTCCCRDYPASRASRFLLLEQLLCPVCFKHSQGSIKDSLNIFCLTDSFA